jgi:hypothetical protein
LYALLIGIDDYPAQEISTLQGAVADVTAMKTFLQDTLHVPKSHIFEVKNADATCDRIISSIRDLAEDPVIPARVPILIFYAGHGATLPKPAAWSCAGPEIQYLVGWDGGKDENSQFVKGVIPDAIFAYYLQLLAEKKGNNIVCNHSHFPPNFEAQ